MRYMTGCIVQKLAPIEKGCDNNAALMYNSINELNRQRRFGKSPLSASILVTTGKMLLAGLLPSFFR